MLAQGALDGVEVTESNCTTPVGREDAERLTVYWQSRAWLSTERLITTRRSRGRMVLKLSEAGRELVARLGAPRPSLPRRTG